MPTIESRSRPPTFLWDRIAGRLWGYKADDGTDVPFAFPATGLQLYGEALRVNRIGFAYLCTFAAAGGTPPYVYSAQGTLPPGLALDAASGVLSGRTMTDGSFTFVPTVTDGASAVATLQPVTVLVTLGTTGNTAPPVDTTAPSFASAQVTNGAPTLIAVTMGEALAGNLPAASAFSATVNGSARAVTAIASVSSTVFSLTLASAVVNGDAVVFSYAKPGSNPLKDAAGNQTASFGPAAVTNNVQAVAADTRPRFWYGPATDYQSGNVAAAFAGATPLTNSANDGKTGSLGAVAASGTQYIWLAVKQSAGAITANDGTGNVGFNGATTAGDFLGAETSPSTSTTVHTDSTGTYLLYRSNLRGITGVTLTLI